jgi:hypothetical protein
MEQDKRRRQLLWALVAINGIAGVTWILAALGIVRGEAGINILYLAIGLVNLLASVVWALNARSSVIE